MSIILILLAFLLVASYVGPAVWRKGELPDSISAMVYDLPRRRQWTWSAWLCLVAVLLFEPLVSATEFLGWWTILFLAGAALTPVVRTDTRRWHYASGVMAGVMSQACVVMICPWWLALWLVFLFVLAQLYARPDGWLARHTEHKGVCVAEVICTAALLGALASGALTSL